MTKTTRPKWMDVALGAATVLLAISMGEYACVALGWSTATWQKVTAPVAFVLILATAPGKSKP